MREWDSRRREKEKNDRHVVGKDVYENVRS